jgi:MFS family permease
MTVEEFEREMKLIGERAASDRFKAFGPALGNFSIQYNLSCAGIAVAIMKSCSDNVGGDCKGGGDFPEPTWAKYVLMGTVFAGAVVGMLTMGYLGDALGRRKALALTLSLTVLGSLGSAILPWGSAEVVYGIIAACRFVLGVGVGGIYPLSATSCAESSKDDGHQSKRVGWAFFWQVPGAMTPYLVALALFAIHGDASSTAQGGEGGVVVSFFGGITSMQFRFIMGLGALPAAINLWLTMRAGSNEQPATEMLPEGSVEIVSSPAPLR